MASAEVRNQRVVDYLHEWYGFHPEPRRSYLNNDEVLDLCTRFLPSAFFTVTQDLDMRGYAGKWRMAVEDGIRDGRNPSEWEFWHHARLRFLEYGGFYHEGHQPPANE